MHLYSIINAQWWLGNIKVLTGRKIIIKNTTKITGRIPKSVPLTRMQQIQKKSVVNSINWWVYFGASNLWNPCIWKIWKKCLRNVYYKKNAWISIAFCTKINICLNFVVPTVLKTSPPFCCHTIANSSAGMEPARITPVLCGPQRPQWKGVKIQSVVLDLKLSKILNFRVSKIWGRN